MQFENIGDLVKYLFQMGLDFFDANGHINATSIFPLSKSANLNQSNHSIKRVVSKMSGAAIDFRMAVLPVSHSSVQVGVAKMHS